MKALGLERNHRGVIQNRSDLHQIVLEDLLSTHFNRDQMAASAQDGTKEINSILYDPIDLFD